ncbi:GTP cyclohydrolase II [Paenibacillus sp. 22594]|uniref:GTP cyclohydrolase II n=1 Tax=Paenibacillus sp. 22594 TaxID=3453947 RepID=UPI003F8635F9
MTISSSTPLVTQYGSFTVTLHKFEPNYECVTFHMGDITEGTPLVRIHSSCLFSEAFHSLDCDCKLQLSGCLERIGQLGKGVVVYLYQEGRGHGLDNKIKAMRLEQEYEIDTVQAFQRLNFELDPREYSFAITALGDLNLSKTIKVASNNFRKITVLKSGGYKVIEQVELTYPVNEHVKKYLEVKREKLGHSISFI